MAGILAIALLISLNITSTQAAVKTGLVCKKVGSVAIVGAYKYTCVKSGKKTVWNKGVKIPVVKPTSVATSTASPISSPTPTPTPAPAPIPTQSGMKTFTRAEVALHNTESDCWTYVDGKVYDLSKWLPEHPGGGSLVLVMCGVDGAAALRDQHKSEQDNALSMYYIG
ncbi:MAG: cytochrome b5-like heme/steroid binding domain-containing protein, partial [Candidatus Planktophila sp.]|nr:cytochrome b5-like heme/steroid binding domain-containing protein [Candidatus Planktophila sp.]